jgi:glutamate synthase (ferredoxin)
MAYNSTLVDHDACGVGFVTQLGLPGSHEVVARAIEALRRLAHRGGVDADGRSGDGAGLLTAIPGNYIRQCASEVGLALPEVFGLGMVFLPPERTQEARSLIAALASRRGLQVLGWRKVPTDPGIVGPRAGETLPLIEQCFLTAIEDNADLERMLFGLRKEAECSLPPGTYFCSLSSRTVVYKGLLTPEQLPAFYPDLADANFISTFAIFHQRYSTNTRPSWSLAQPFRAVAHNGEINTISANRRWSHAREASLLKSLELPPDLQLLEQGVSDSASFDNVLEHWLRRGHSVAAAISCMVPPAWENDQNLSPDWRRFFESHSLEQEPWDGPAALIFTDGVRVGAKLDRNGLRPLRYTLTSDGWLVVGSEVGIADFTGKTVVERQRLGPGEMLLADPASGTMVRPQEFTHIAEFPPSKPVRSPVRIASTEPACVASRQNSKKIMAALGWSEDQYRLLFQPLVVDAKEAVWSMGDDAPPAFLSTHRRSLWDHCKQRFAQVTNPPIDPLREAHVMSLNVYLSDSVTLPSPLIDSGQLEIVEQKLQPSRRIDFTFPEAGGIEGAKHALYRLQREAKAAASRKAGLILLSDSAVSADRIALPALLAVAAVWNGMVEAGIGDIPLIVETGQVFDIHHLALLVAAGASAILPFLAFEQAETLKPDGARKFRLAVEVGFRKVMARMGISTVASYRNSQLFETIGLDAKLCQRFFPDAGRALGGKSLDDLLHDTLERHAAAFIDETQALRDRGLYRFRQHGEQHANSPELIRRMHRYLKSGTEENYLAFTELAEKKEPLAIRDLLEIRPARSIPLNDVESEAAVLSRFSTQAMSLGAVSPETHRTLAIAMNRLGGRSNTGEGGEDPEIYRVQSEANNRVKQVASARFGVTAEYLIHADELEIKIAQGAKPGEGGQLPASKVSPYIARLRHAVPNMTLISPPPHHDIYSIEDLAQLIYDLRAINPQARIGVKLVSSTGVGIIATGVAKAGADVITISGYDGGTGASPLTSIKNTGLPWEVGLRDAHAALVRTGLRARVRLRADGGFKFARDVIVAALLGADEFGFGTAALLAVGCVMARQCHLNTCPVGIATQDETLRSRFAGTPEHIETYFRRLATDVRGLLATLGASSIDEIVGSVRHLRPRDSKAKDSFAEFLQPLPRTQQVADAHQADGELQRELARSLDETDVPDTRSRRFSITNADRSIGANLTGDLLRRSPGGLTSPMDYEFFGTAGQSFGAFLTEGVNFRLRGEANDYVGKGLCGGTIAVTADAVASLRGDVLVGNTVLYGATAGELYVAGRAGERFAVRNSGALAVVEGVGQHGCEYMTAGICVVLGPAGNNFGAGMTGGLAYLLRDSVGGHGYNHHSVRIVPLQAGETVWLRRVLCRHLQLTDSPLTARILASELSLSFLRVEPLSLPCSIPATWAPILKRFGQRPTWVPDLPRLLPSAEPSYFEYPFYEQQ